MKEHSSHSWHLLRCQDSAWNAYLPEAFAGSEGIVVRYHNRVVYKLEIPGQGVVYAKWFTPQNAGLKSSLRARMKRLFDGPVSRRIFRIHESLLESGFACAEPLLAAWHCWDMTELFLCREVKAPMSQTLLCSMDEQGIKTTLSAVADDMQRLHRAGFVLGDAIPGNILWNGERIFYLDNDRTRHYPMIMKHACLRNVVQFCSHIPPECSLANASDFFISHYARSFLNDDEIVQLKGKIARRTAVIAEERKIKRSLS